MRAATLGAALRLVLGFALVIPACNAVIGAGAPTLVDGFGGARGQGCMGGGCAGRAGLLDPPLVAQSAGEGGASGAGGGESGPSGAANSGAAGAVPDTCGTADGECPKGCTDATDGDCPKEPGEACSLKDECRTGVCSAEGVCCNSACGNSCYSCKVPAFEGTCTAIDYSKSSDVKNCGSCGAACSTTNIAPSCSGGVCGGMCSAGYADCSTQSNDGCKTTTSRDPLNCGACGAVCKYGSCVASSCEFTRVGPGPDSGVTFRLGVGASLFAMQLGGIAAGKVAALGLLATVDNSNDNPVDVYLALYADVAGVPGAFVAQSELLRTTDASIAPTEGSIDPPVTIAAGNYWLVLMVSDTIRLHAMGASFTTNWFHNTVPVKFAKINQPLTGDLRSQTLSRAIMYAITTP